MSQSKLSKIDHRGLILGEGADEIELFGSLVKHLGIAGVQVEQYGGKQSLSRFLKQLPGRSGFDNLRQLCITRDVDNSDDPHYQPIPNILQGINDALGIHNLPQPDRIESIVGKTDGLRVGIFLLPGQGRDGAFEDLCLDFIANDASSPCIDNYFECLRTVGLPQPKIKTMQSKARIYAWLASREVADLARLGLSSKSEYNYVPWEHAAFEPLKTFLLDLFADAVSPQE